MRRYHPASLILGLGLLLAGGPAVAHHSVSAEFDSARRVELTGVVTKIEWTNPHTYFYIDAANPRTGNVEIWALELGSPNGLMRQGFTRSSMKIGDVVTVAGTLAKDGANKANTKSVVLSDGKTLFAVSSGTESP